MYVYNLYNGELFTYEMEGFGKKKDNTNCLPPCLTELGRRNRCIKGGGEGIKGIKFEALPQVTILRSVEAQHFN